MRKKRINSTLQLRLSVLTGGESVSLEGRDIKVFLVDPRGNKFEQDFQASGNVVTFVYEGKEQFFTGIYRTEIYENYMEDNMASLDVDCFEIVPRTKMENDDIDDLAIETIDISAGNLMVSGKDGIGIKDIYQKVKSEESSGTNVVSVVLDNDVEKDFYVMNGEKGEKGDDGEGADTSEFVSVGDALTNMEIEALLNL